THSLCSKGFIQFLQHPPQLLSEQLIHLADPAVFLERSKFEIIPPDLQAGYDVVTYPLQPPALLVGESLPLPFLPVDPGAETIVDMLLERLQHRLLMQGKTDQGDDVGPEAPAPGPLDLGSLQGSIGVPQPVDAPQVRRLLNHLGQTLDLVVFETLMIGAAVKDLQGGNLVLVLLDELFKRLHQPLGLAQRLGIETGLNDLVGADRVDDLVGLTLQLQDLLPETRLAERLHSLLDQLDPGLPDLFHRRVADAKISPGLPDLLFRVD